MEDHEDLCLCFHVTAAKIKKFIRLNKPVRESQLSECYGAGTGCGWCRPFLKSLFESELSGDSSQQQQLSDISADEYSELRRDYRKRKSDSANQTE